MAVHYTIAYTAIATTLSASVLAGELAAIPRDTDTEAELGLTLVSDGTINTATTATRTIEYSNVPGPTLLGDPATAEVLVAFYQGVFAFALSTPISPAPVVVT
jgi:hypothetical protein